MSPPTSVPVMHSERALRVSLVQKVLSEKKEKNSKQLLFLLEIESSVTFLLNFNLLST